MGMNYKPLWKLLIDRDMTKGKLREISGISTRAMAKMGRNEDINTDVLRKICAVLQCSLSEIVELVPDNDVNKPLHDGQANSPSEEKHDC